jgi:hypothetical protein
MYASPDSTALVGINWDNLRSSPFAGVVSAELTGPAGLGFPDLDILKDPSEILISSPALLAAETGDFPDATLRQQALAHKFKHMVYRGVTLWISPRTDLLSVAQIGEGLVLLGARETLQAAIDNSLAETGRVYSPLLERAARFSATGDLWVVAARLPDPLAGLFVPVDADATGFDGQVSVRGGLELQATIQTASAEAANALAAQLRQAGPSLPSVARGLEVAVQDDSVNLALHVTPAELSAGLRHAPPEPPAAQQQAVLVRNGTSLAAPEQVPAPVPHAVAKPAPRPAQPQVIRILGLDGGPQEIPFPDPPASQP